MNYIVRNMFQPLKDASCWGNPYRFLFKIVLLAAVIVASHGCSSGQDKQSYAYGKNPVRAEMLPEERILGLDPEHISAEDVAGVLSHFPAPRIINLNGSVPIVTMDSFSKFLVAMGYPENSVRNFGNGGYSYSSYISSEKLAGYTAWYYEKEGMMPMLIGHSRGGMMVVKVLHELAGAFNESLSVWNPLTGESEGRDTITDPLTNRVRNVIGLKIGYASAIATGRFMRIVQGQWNMLGRLRNIPDTVEEFAGYHIRYDFLGGDLFGNRYSSPSVPVYNVTLPAGYSHITLPLTEHLARNRDTREWINNYVPRSDEPSPPSELLSGDIRNILFVAEQWFYIKKHWCLELQKLVRSGRKIPGQ